MRGLRKYPLNCRCLLLALALSTAGCAVMDSERHPDIFSYAYLSLNFSGKGWDAARAHCESRGKKAKHQATHCGFLICTTKVACVDEPPT